MPSRRADGTLVFRVVVYGPSMSENIEVFKWVHGIKPSVGSSKINKSLALKKSSDIIQIPMGQTILQSFDRSVANVSNMVFQVITVTGQQRHQIKHEDLLKGADAIIFTWDRLLDQWKENIEDLKELLRFFRNKLIPTDTNGSPDVAMVVLATNADQEDIVEIPKIREALNTAYLYHVLIYETIVTTGVNILRAFVYVGRQAVLNHYRKLKKKKKKKDVDTRPVRVLRGGQIEGGEYVFKIKVINNGKYNITDVNIYIHSYPEESLVLSRIDGHPETPPDRAKFHKISKGGGFVSPSFIFKPSKDCIKGSIHSFISFINEEDQIKSISVEPHEIRMICGLLKPKVVSNEEFENLTIDLLTFIRNDKEFTIPCKAEEIYQKLLSLLKSKNFAIVDAEKKESEGKFLGTVKGFAEGSFNKCAVGLKLTLTGNINEQESVLKIDIFAEDEDMTPSIISEFENAVNPQCCPECEKNLPLELVRKLIKGLTIYCESCGSKLLEISGDVRAEKEDI